MCCIGVLVKLLEDADKNCGRETFCADPKLLEMIYLRKRVRKKRWNQLKGVFYLILELDLYLTF